MLLPVMVLHVFAISIHFDAKWHFYFVYVSVLCVYVIYEVDQWIGMNFEGLSSFIGRFESWQA